LFERPYLEKNPTQKMTGGVAQGVAPEFKPQYCRKKKRKITMKSFTLSHPATILRTVTNALVNSKCMRLILLISIIFPIW
jgi:hypothetical protein